MGYATEGTARAALAALTGGTSDMEPGQGGYATEGTLRALAEALEGGGSGGGSELPDGTTNGQVLKWNATAGEWEPGTDTNTTYAQLTAADAEAGTATAARSISAKVLADEIDRRIAAALAPEPDPEL